MPRIEFDGEGRPIPTIALPPFGSDTDIPTTVLTFTENTDFPVDQYKTLGFTHFEVICVGAAGGRGGDPGGVIEWVVTKVSRPVPQDVWNLRLEQVRITDFMTSGEWDHVYGWSGGAMRTMVQQEEFSNPTHLMTFTTYQFPYFIPQPSAMGGAGGGGGMHKVFGALSDLPDIVPIVVGKAGSDAPYGQTSQNGSLTPTVSFTPRPPDSRGYPWSRDVELYNFLTPYLTTYPTSTTTFENPVKGDTGGYSAFGTISLASGGDGGFPGKAWNGSQFVVNGRGGNGGIGGRIEAGGGGLGSIVDGANGIDGVWHPEIGIGAGGGGGKGANGSNLATAGGQGSYSFADTSVYGQRQFRQPWTYLKPIVSSDGTTVNYVLTTEASSLIIPGGGGGARPSKNLKVGSKAPGYSPNGVVTIRLSQIL